MNSIFGIGPLELVLIVIIMILVLGPQQMVVTAKKAGTLMRKIVKSPMWRTIMDTSREIREIPTKLVREAGLEEEIRDIKSTSQSFKDLRNLSVSADPVILKGNPGIPPANPIPPAPANPSRSDTQPTPANGSSIPNEPVAQPEDESE